MKLARNEREQIVTCRRLILNTLEDLHEKEVAMRRRTLTLLVTISAVLLAFAAGPQFADACAGLIG